MEPLYNIYYAGEILAGYGPDQVRSSLGALFKAGDATLDKLFSGTPQLVKRECDRATALKYKQAMEKVGARPVIKTASPAAAAEPEAAKPQTAAERIAALAAAPDVGTAPAPGPQPTAVPAEAGTDSSGLNLSPAGTEVLRPGERPQVVVAEIDTSALDIDPPADRLAGAAPPPPPAPDTSHLSMGEVGEDIPTLASTAEPLSPNTDALVLAPEGTDFSDCARPEAAPPELDLSALAVSPPGTDVLDEEQRKLASPPPPDTAHITLEH
ncbi:hypothetical protein DWB85_11240 [Seongchinamella sediminis]|uniref:Uncharacterized protein n=1 Tax=Seongchinamella sediminis TaxID=2283635 RepID=A0A3L7DY73_9GAMM|nr:hypothetical protein [Seongchinamella sediminis]RLQ21589.1 hypothetical protein DWB85_11240 [Seongchinamella sediminis]